VIIRQPSTADADSIFALHVAAFDSDAEAKLTERLQRQARPLISLVAE